jgi:hypothetical protein
MVANTIPAPGVIQDADSSAKLIWTLKLLGRQAEATELVKNFETETHFKTWVVGETKPSFSINSNVLGGLVSVPDPTVHKLQIIKVVRFLLGRLRNGTFHDKWVCLCHSLI